MRSDCDPSLFFDLRALNGKDNDKFISFWDKMGEYLQLEVGESAHERRHAVDAISYASKIVSVPVLIREVAKLLHATEGHEEDPIPGKDCVRHQFTPNHKDHLTAGKFSGRFKIIRKVQTRCLRKEHEDAHWVAALAKYNKAPLCAARDAAVEAGLPRGVLAAGLDDMKQMPVGLPGLPVSSGARAHGPVAAGQSKQLNASDHDSHRQGAIATSLSLVKDIPEHPGDSWYRGTPSVVLHDAVFEKSNPFFHAANLLLLLRRLQDEARQTGEATWATQVALDTYFLSLQTDGGADHNNTKLQVKLSLLALKRCLGLKRLDSQRCAPSASATLVHERVFSLLNLGLQHTSFARPQMEAELEAMVRNLSSMAEIRFAAGVGPPPKRAKVKEQSSITGKRPAAPAEDKAEGAGEESEDEEKEEEEVDDEGEEMVEDETRPYVVDSITAQRT